MQSDAINVVRDYAEAVFRRARVPMEPLGYEVNWADQPSRHKTYPGAHRIALSTATPTLASLRSLLTGEGLPAPQSWTLDRLATLLRLSNGILDRRLTVNWNQDIANRVHFPHAVWGRGTASGGGMYPVEVYCVVGPSGPLLPGVYHYASGHHAFERLLTGDVSATIRAAIPPTPPADSFLLASIKFWKNAFKYNSFCYHVVTQDLGAMLGSWDLLGRALGAPLRRLLAFDPAPLDDLLGLDRDAESIFAVVPLTWAEDGKDTTPAVADDGAVRLTHSAAPRVQHVPFERSRDVLVFPQIVAVHRAAMAPTTPSSEGLAMATPGAIAGDQTPLPPVELDQLDRPLSTVLRVRSSSFGRFRRPPEMTGAQLGTTLAVAAAARRYPADIKEDNGGPGLTRLWAFVNHVDGIAAGTYAYDDQAHALLAVKPAPQPSMSAFLQQQYFLTNYTMDQVAAVLAISGRLDAMLAAFGPRGYRILNAEVGTVAQSVYCAAAAQGIGCGAVLGFDNVAMNEALDIDNTDERTVLFLLLGRQLDVAAGLVYRL